MPDWKKIVTRHHSVAHADDDYRLETGNGASPESITKIGNELGLVFPEEFASLYQTFNGIGVSSEHDDDIWWLFCPLEQLPEFGMSIRDSFSEYHPNIAERFFPFIDWANGVGTGYLLDEGGRVFAGMYTFEHEALDYDEDQDPEEFLTSLPVSIEEFLSSV